MSDRKSVNKKILLGFVGVVVVLALIAALSGSGGQESQTTAQNEHDTSQITNPRDRLDVIAKSSLGDKLREVSIVGSEDKGFGVLADFNAGDNLTKGLIKSSIEATAAQLITNIYKSGINVTEVTASAFHKVQVGNKESDAMVYMIGLNKPASDEVDWNREVSDLRNELPKIWEVQFTHKDLR